MCGGKRSSLLGRRPRVPFEITIIFIAARARQTGARSPKRSGKQTQTASDQWFDEAYYQRYYYDPRTRVVDPSTRAGWATSWQQLAHLHHAGAARAGHGLRRLWRETVTRDLPAARYQGVEYSDYLYPAIRLTGHGSVLDWQADEPSDLVIRQACWPT